VYIQSRLGICLTFSSPLRWPRSRNGQCTLVHTLMHLIRCRWALRNFVSEGPLGSNFNKHLAPSDIRNASCPLVPCNSLKNVKI
jgi:hypothetical protein